MKTKQSAGKILIVDDEKRMCESLSRLLTGLGYETRTTENPKTALEEIHLDAYDLILTDIKMPSMDGFDLLKAVKEKDKDALVVFMTGYGSLESALEAMSQGAYDYLLKPLELEDLKKTIQRGMEKRKADQEKNQLLREIQTTNHILAKRVQELDALYQAGKSISTTVELNQFLSTLLLLATKVIGAKVGSIMLLDEEKKELTIKAAIGLDQEVVQKTVLQLGDSISGYVAEKGMPLIVEDVESDPRFKRINKTKYETHSLLSAPLRFKDRVMGVINLNNKQDGSIFTADDLRLLATFAYQAAIAIDDAYHYNQVNNKANQLSVLYEVATGIPNLGEFKEVAQFIFLKLREIVPVDSCLWLSWNKKEQLLHLQYAEGEIKPILIGELEIPFKTDEVFNSERLLKRLEESLAPGQAKTVKEWSFTLVPILAADSLHGIFCVGSSAGLEITQPQKEIVSIVASQAAYLYERQQALSNATRLMTMGNLISEITHDLKKPLTNIRSALQILREKQNSGKSQKELLLSAEQEILRLTGLVQELLSFSQPDNYQSHRKSIVPIMDKALKLTESDLEQRKIKLSKKYAKSLPAIMVNEKSLLEVFLNILLNALESMSAGGKLSVSIDRNQPPGQIKEYLNVTISDTGAGISPDNLEKIFERYYTTKEAGSGLGLAVVDRVIKAHNGYLKVKSTPGKGTVFSIFLPVD